jgi:excisionase family DNA binding protein
MAPDDNRRFYRVREAADLCETDERVLRKMIAAGEIPVRRFGRKVVIPAEWVNAQIGRGLQPPAPPRATPDQLADLVAAKVAAEILAHLAEALAVTAGRALRARDVLDDGDAPVS